MVAYLHPADLHCEYLTNLLGIDATLPRLSWRMESSDAAARAQRQTAYQVLDGGVESRERFPGGSWIWHPTAGETTATVRMQNTFELPADAKPERARFTITADDSYTVWLNGERIGSGDNWQNPGRDTSSPPRLATAWTSAMATCHGPADASCCSQLGRTVRAKRPPSNYRISPARRREHSSTSASSGWLMMPAKAARSACGWNPKARRSPGTTCDWRLASDE